MAPCLHKGQAMTAFPNGVKTTELLLVQTSDPLGQHRDWRNASNATHSGQDAVATIAGITFTVRFRGSRSHRTLVFVMGTLLDNRKTLPISERIHTYAATGRGAEPSE